MNILKKMFKGNTLYYPGCLTKFVLKDIQANYEKILKLEGIDYIKLTDKELCCGSPVKNAGNKKIFKGLAEKNLKIFKEHGVDRIITNCPACALVLRKDYKEILGDDWDIEVRHMTEIISDKTLKGLKNKGTVTYHDPCHLGRAQGIYEEPREIIKKSGFKIEEMSLNREESYCCGAGGGVKTNNPELSNKIAGDRFDQAEKIKAEKIITPCPMCYAQFKENYKSKNKDLEIKEGGKEKGKKSGQEGENKKFPKPLELSQILIKRDKK